MILPGWRSRSPPGPPRLLISPYSRERRALNTGLLVSAVLHLLLVALYPFLLGDPEPRARRNESATQQPIVEGTQIVQIIELPEPPELPQEVIAEESPAESLQPEVFDLEVIAGGDDTPATEPEEDEEGLTVAEQLRPRIIDPRVWAPLDPDYTQLTDEERAQLLLRGMIESWNDSIAVAEALSERATDWSYTDDEGRRWGLSPGRLHLGDFSIPLPFSFALPPGRREALAERQLIRDDLARGAATAIIRETWAERARAIRERLEAERAPPDPRSMGDNGDRGGDR